MVCPISISTASGTVHGIVRDISTGGIFFYANFKPVMRARLDFSLQLKGKKISGQGEVIRIEHSAPGAAFGIALKLSSNDGW